MMTRTQLSLEREMLSRARRKASEQGISLAEYVRRLVAKDLGATRPGADVRLVFNLGRSERSDIAREKDKMIGDAIAKDRGLA